MIKHALLLAALLLFAPRALSAQPSGEYTPGGRERLVSPWAAPQAHNAAGAGTLPLRRISLYASGVGFFEHAGETASAGTVLTFPFHLSAVDDALKSLTVILPPSARAGSPPLSVSYPVLDVSLRVPGLETEGRAGIAEILRGLRGEEIEIGAPVSVQGRLLAVETRGAPVSSAAGEEVFISVFGGEGIRVINLRDIAALRFRSPTANAALAAAMDRMIMERTDDSRDLAVAIPGNLSGPVRIGYVIPVPVWKVSYRLDLSGSNPFLQGWAIVDNDSDTAWEGVELTLVSGRPVSFVQNLYPPYHVFRPTLPLAIAGTAQAKTWEGGLASGSAADAGGPAHADNMLGARARSSVMMEDAAPYAPVPAPESAVRWTGAGFTPAAEGAGLAGQFQFTLNGAVTIAAGQSSMIPLVEGSVEARKILIFSGARAQGGTAMHPAIGAEIVNKTGMKLPAGPITIYDGGSYAGDALIEFFPENEKRLISWGDDLSVAGSRAGSQSHVISAVTVSRGVMTISRRRIYETVYTFRSSSAETKRLIIEHPATPGASLLEPEDGERTASSYRFSGTLPAGGTAVFTVREERPLSEQVHLAPLATETLLSYAADTEIPARARSALERAVVLRRAVESARTALSTRETRRRGLVEEQDRTRRNLEAAGSQTPQGQEYLVRLGLEDAQLDSLAEEIAGARTRAEAAEQEYQNYLESLSFQ
ncbi:MAG: DUF4139 domain-containing protein [Spirochaetaceae bacterium]|jgi:hypothetical protein|nr:DUF4139 domain-containing protein [Spirochaetaceae bacterium]